MSGLLFVFVIATVIAFISLIPTPGRWRREEEESWQELIDRLRGRK